MLASSRQFWRCGMELGAVHQDVANPMPLSQENITRGILHIPISTGMMAYPPALIHLIVGSSMK